MSGHYLFYLSDPHSDKTHLRKIFCFMFLTNVQLPRGYFFSGGEGAKIVSAA